MDASANWYNVPGRLRRHEGELLRELATGQAVLEIGSLFGRSTICLAQVARHVHAVDPHRAGNCDWCDEYRGRDTLTELRQNLRAAGVESKVTLHVCTVSELWSSTVPLFGLAFIDGSHRREDVLQDLEFAFRCLYPWGKIACHDHTTGHPGVMRAVEEFGRPVKSQVGGLAVIHFSQHRTAPPAPIG